MKFLCPKCFCLCNHSKLFIAINDVGGALRRDECVDASPGGRHAGSMRALAVMDEGERITDRVGELIFSILDYRYMRNSSTWITSNHSGQEMSRRLGDDRGPAILRRIRETSLSWQRAKMTMPIGDVAKGGRAA